MNEPIDESGLPNLATTQENEFALIERACASPNPEVVVEDGGRFGERKTLAPLYFPPTWPQHFRR